MDNNNTYPVDKETCQFCIDVWDCKLHNIKQCPYNKGVQGERDIKRDIKQVCKQFYYNRYGRSVLHRGTANSHHIRMAGEFVVENNIIADAKHYLGVCFDSIDY